MDVQWSVLLARYGEQWRFRRKIVERSFYPGSLAAYRAIQETKARVLTTRLLQGPREWISHIELSVFFLPFLFTLRFSIIHTFSQFPKRTVACHDIRLRDQRASGQSDRRCQEVVGHWD